ncbi:MAG: metallophosphoesterase [Armatimonadetes bacterium]|nr:metallophosphoesterase [Armatimonadota bacterium]
MKRCLTVVLLVLGVAAQLWAAESWTLALLPDTQNYCEKWPAHYEAQTRWLSEHARELRVPMAIHLGDIVNVGNSTAQWQVAEKAMAPLRGVVPTAYAWGNHDYLDPAPSGKRASLFDKGPLARPEPTLAGVMEPGSLANSYHIFRAGGRAWLALCLEYGPRDRTIAWANRVLEQYPGLPAIVATHAYLHHSSQRLRLAAKQEGEMWFNPHAYAGFERLAGGVSDGEELWDRLIRRHANVVFVFSGHVFGSAHLTSRNDAGALVHQILTDFQGEAEGGGSLLPLLTIAADGRSAQMRCFAPSTGKWRDDAATHYDLDLRGTAAEVPSRCLPTPTLR